MEKLTKKKKSGGAVNSFGVTKTEWFNMTTEQRCQAAGWRNDLMSFAAMSSGKVLGNKEPMRQGKKESQEKPPAELPHFYGGEDLYSGPWGPPQDNE